MPTVPERRYLAVISGVRTREKGFIFATGVEKDRAEYFVHISGVRSSQLWEQLDVGDAISCRVEITPKGLRAHDIKLATAQEKALIDAVPDVEEESRGNR